jgi:hypothetical protein
VKYYILNTLLLFFGCLYGNIDQSMIGPRYIEAIGFESFKFPMLAQIILSDGSSWKLECSLGDELTLSNWSLGNEIYLSSSKKDGYELLNRSDFSRIYAFPTIKTVQNAVKIDHIEHISAGWFSKEYYIFHLNDGTSWKTSLFERFPSYRWKSGQSVLISKGILIPQIVNLKLQNEPSFNKAKAYDDRSLDVVLYTN